ncbi:hypothetical protein OGZ01_25540 [Vibrio harveyi]|nr:hypothetical protein [Vibrio harveyi]
MFDYRWNQVEAGDKTSERASQILTDVKYALSGTNSNNSSFFGFDPTVTAYATNEMLEKPIPNVLTNDYLHRFLVEVSMVWRKTCRETTLLILPLLSMMILATMVKQMVLELVVTKSN